MTVGDHSLIVPDHLSIICAKMFSLRLLGGAAIHDREGPLGGRVSQRRRLALLSILAIARQRPVSRDRLLALLWPESDTERARHSLADSLYQIRKELGENAILSISDDVLLNAQVVQSDAAMFEESLERGALRDAAEGYAGPFLDGFHVGVSEFEAWQDAERDRLARMYGSTLRELAADAEAEGHVDEAIEWFRRLGVHEPYDSRVALRLMEALARAGDRAGALRHARAHARLLRDELDVEPDAPVLALAERLRSEQLVTSLAGDRDEPAGDPSLPEKATPAQELDGARQSAPVARTATRRPRTWAAAALAMAVVFASGVFLSRSSGAPHSNGDGRGEAVGSGSRVIAVLPFENLAGSDQDAAFAGGIHNDLITALSRVPGLTVISRAAVLPYQDGPTSPRRIGEDLAVDVLLAGGVQRSGQDVRINVQLSDATTGQLLWAESFARELTMSNLFAIQSGITERVVAFLERSLPDAELVRLGTPPTEDLTAYQLFHQANRAFNGTRAGNLESARLLRLALAADTTQARAWARLAGTYAWRTILGFPTTAWDSALVFAERALELDASDDDAHTARAVVYTFQGRLSDAERILRRVLEINPNHPLAVRRLAEIHRDRGEFDDALRYHLASLRLAPDQLPFRIWVGITYANLGDLATAARWYESVLQLDPAYLWALEGVAFLHLLRGQADSARHHADRFARLHPDEPRGLASAAAIAHYLRDSERTRMYAQRALDSADPGAPIRHGAGAGLGTLTTTLLGFAYLQTGDSAWADRLFEESLSFLDDMVSQGADTPRWPYETGLIRMARGDTTGAIAALDSAYERGFRWTWMLDLEPMLDPLRSHPHFQQLVERMSADVSAMRRTLERGKRGGQPTRW